MTGRLRIRPALPSDRPAMLEITRGVWEGTDYVPYVWDSWLGDPGGSVAVACLDGRPVGLQHQWVQPDGTCWLEGIRVAGALERQGIAQALVEYGVQWARERDCPAVRLSTWSGNPASGRAAEKRGLAVIASYVPLRANPDSASAADRSVRLALPSDLEQVEDFLVRAVARGRAGEFYSEGWTLYRLARDRLRLLLATNGVIVAGDGEIDGLAIATLAQPFTTLRVGFLAGSPEAVTALAGGIRRGAAEAGIVQIAAFLVPDEALLAAAGHAGFERRADSYLLLHELELREE
ncbi:MAG: GNAT family N-acetyltransferase [Chloroflexi bacterium]|nr:GNAT family N-acetyltransferase [Chloroflexota bacterium]